VTGSTLFLLEKTDNFERSFKKLVKSYKSKLQQQEFVEIIGNYLEQLIVDPYPAQARDEPLASGMKIPDLWTFHKLAFTTSKGASGQIRLIYLVNESEKVIKILWIYNHEQFRKRPPDKDLKDVLKEAFEVEEPDPNIEEPQLDN
jgi:mRNA-degrading endonuclease YafQ of YafQ-DinJ toxin-antitoxin module